MTIYKFDEKELEVVSTTPPGPFAPEINNYNYPVTPREAYLASFNREPIWQITGAESRIFAPGILPDNIARGMVIENKTFDPLTQGGGKDMFGLEWEYVPVAEGSMIRPGQPLMDDANDWREKIVWPDIDSWNWAASAELNDSTFLTPELATVAWFQNGWFERLITFMDFENAAVALIDEDQKSAVKELLSHISDLYIRIFEKYLTYFPVVDTFYIHDDWGSKNSTFFSPTIGAEMIVPAMKKVVDFIHSKGRFAELHSCGCNITQAPNFIAAGWDAWGPQGAVNDTPKIYDQYGDKILIGVMPDSTEPLPTDIEQRQAADSYADRFCNPDKPSFFHFEGGGALTPAYRKELYIRSRINYSVR